MTKEKIGVIVARFQVDALTPGHQHIIKLVQSQNDKVVVVLGTAQKPDWRNPLNFQMRRDMVLSHEIVYGKPAVFMVLQHQDNPGNDVAWSQDLDLLLDRVFPDTIVRLYGGRDCFKPHYKGKFGVVEVRHTEFPSGTDARTEINQSPPYNSVIFRRGVIWAVLNYLPREGWEDYVV